MLKYISITIILMSTFYSCTENAIEAKVEASKKPIQLYYDSKTDVVFRILFPINLTITNNSFFEKEINDIRYIFSNPNKGNRMLIFEDDGLTKIKDYHIKIAGKKKKKLVLYSNYILLNSEHRKILREKYSSRINGNELINSIGNLEHFKQENKDLFHFITKNDSISISLVESYGEIRKMRLTDPSTGESFESSYQTTDVERFILPINWEK